MSAAILTRVEVEALLRRWGRVFGQRPQTDEEPTSGYRHPIALAMEHAPGKADKRVASHRDGRAQRIILGEAAGLTTQDGKRTRPVPVWATEPVTGTQTQGARGRWYPDPEADRVELAWHDLYRCARLPAIVLRCEYCLRGAQQDKCSAAIEITSAPMKLRRYRIELETARVWMHGRLIASAAA